MPSEVILTKGQAKEGAPYTSVHHIKGPDNTEPLKADLSGTSAAEIAYSVYDLGAATPTTAIVTGTYNKTVVWFDALQTDGFWDNEDGGTDDDGYNFRGVHAATDFPNGAGTYRVEYQAVSTAFTLLTWEEEVTVIERFTA